MDFEFEDESLRRLHEERDYTGGFQPEIVKAFRKRMQIIHNAPDERDFYQMKSWHYEKLQGEMEGLRSIRLNLKWRLIVRIEERQGGKVVMVISIIDYH